MRQALLLALLIALPLHAHSRAQVAAHAPDGGSQERLTSIAILPKPGAPFTATVETEWTRLLEDGTRTTVKNHRTVARDSSGRIFQERRYLTADGDAQLSALQYSDPLRHEFLDCEPRTKICTVHPYHAPESVAHALPSAMTLPDGSVTREDLGQRQIENLTALGSREITTIRGVERGYKQAEPTIKEFWYSPRLEINLVSKRFEARGGAQNFDVKSINLSEPDPRLFAPPQGYKIARLVTE